MDTNGRTYGGEWLPSNAGTYAEAVKTTLAPPPGTSPPPRPGSPAPGRGASRRGFLAGVASTAVVARAGGAIAGTAGTLSYLQRQGTIGREARPIPLAAAPVVTTAATAPALDLASLYKAIAPAVVGIEVTTGRGAG